ncbi:MAG: hypothetical protein ACR2O3_01450 [Rhizobiaceae bacterium]
MLLEIILYFSLGFLVAVLLMLIVTPAIWNRAVVLTRQKVESTLPLSLNEIQAEKDKLRADFAMTTRRLELGIEELRKKASEQNVELHSKRDEANRINVVSKQGEIKIGKLETAAESMRENLADNHEKIESLTKNLDETSEELKSLRDKYEALRVRQSGTEEQLNKSKITLVASESKIDSLSGTLSTVNLTDEERTLKIKSLYDQIEGLKSSLREQEKKATKSEAEAKSVQKKLQSAQDKLEKLSDSPKSAGGKQEKLRSEIADLTQQLIRENAKVVELEAKLAQNMLRTEIAAEYDTGSGTVLKDTQGLGKENSDLVEEIKKTAKANGSKNGMNQQTKRKLKKKIQNLAAKTSASVADLEGENSPINSIVENTSGRDGGEETSLAGEIRSLRDPGSTQS